jgi:hypothetical protein
MRTIIGIFITGLIMHQAKRLTEQLPRGYEQIADHAIGGISMLGVFPLMARMYGMKSEEIKTGETALAIGLLAFGGGVVMGWLLDTPIWQRRK